VKEAVLPGSSDMEPQRFPHTLDTGHLAASCAAMLFFRCGQIMAVDEVTDRPAARDATAAELVGLRLVVGLTIAEWGERRHITGSSDRRILLDPLGFS